MAEVVQRYGICGQELRAVALVARQQGKGALQQPTPSVHVTSIDRSLAGVGEEPSRADAQFFPGLVEWAKLRPESIRLLEVVTENLLVLDLAITGRPRQPSGKTLVQLSSIMLRQRLIGCVPNQQMPESEGVVAGEVRAIWKDELLAYQSGQGRFDLVAQSLRLEVRDGSTPERLADDGGAFHDSALGGHEPVDTRRE